LIATTGSYEMMAHQFL